MNGKFGPNVSSAVTSRTPLTQPEPTMYHVPFKDAPVHGWDDFRSECPEIWPPLERLRELALRHEILCRDDR